MKLQGIHPARHQFYPYPMEFIKESNEERGPIKGQTNDVDYRNVGEDQNNKILRLIFNVRTTHDS